MTRLAAIIVVLFFAAGFGLSADEWTAPRTRVVASDDGLRFVRIVPGTNRIGALDAVPGQRNARGEFYVRAADSTYKLIAGVDLQNPVSPVDARLTNDGYLVTFDNWGAIGKGFVVTFYKPDGQLLRHIRLEELYRDGRQLQELPVSTSSIRWRCGVWTWISPGEGTFVHVNAPHGGYFKLMPETGDFTYYEGERPSSCGASSFQ
jgi:hypothetical protein